MLLLLATACIVPGSEKGDALVSVASDLQIEVDEAVPTLLRVTWVSDSALPGRVAWRIGDEEPGRTALDTSTTTHAHELLVPAGEAVTLEVLHRLDDGTEEVVATEIVDIETAPSWLPAVEVDLAPEDPETPYLYVVTQDLVEMHATLQVVDWAGRPLWWRAAGEEAQPFAQPSRDGSGFVYAAMNEGTDSVVRLGWDGTRTVTPAPGAHHEVHERADGSVGTCRSEARDIDGTRVAVDVLSVVAPDGTTRDVWDALEVYDPAASTRCEGLDFLDGTKDGTHCNGVSFDEEKDTWLVSLYCQGSVHAIRDATGEVAWTIGGEAPTVQLAERAQFSLAHAPRSVDGALWLFDNGTGSMGSRVLSIDIDTTAATGTLLTEWRSPASDFTPVLGSAVPYGDGLLTSFGTSHAGYWLGSDGALLASFAVPKEHAISSVGGIGALSLQGLAR